MRHTRLLAAVALTTALALVTGGCSGGSQEADSTGPIKVGIILDTTGPISPYGVPIENAAKLAVKQFNAAGGAGGREVELAVEDTRSDIANVPTAFRKLEGEGVTAVYGPNTSGGLTRLAPVAQQVHLPIICPTSVEEFAPGTLNEWTYRSSPLSSEAVLQAALVEIKKELGFSKLAVFHDAQNSVAIGEKKILESVADKVGFSIVAEATVPEGSTDVTGAVTKIASASPDVIFMTHLTTENALFMKSARSRGVTATFIGAAQFGDPKLAELAGGAADGAYAAVPFSSLSSRPQAVDFVADYTAEYAGEVPSVYAAEGYDAMNVLLAAIKAAGSSDRTAVKDAIGDVDMEGVVGPIRYDGGSDNVAGKISLFQWKGTDLVSVE